jgi:transposase
VVGAIAWHLRVGGPWRALPQGFPPWRTVYGWFRRWLDLGLFDALLRETARRRLSRPAEVVHPEVCLRTGWRTAMPRKRHKPEEIVAKLRQVDVLVSQGQGVADAVRSIGVTEVTYYRWRQEYGGLKTEQIRRLKELETENARLRRAVADLTLDKLILKEAASGNY